VVSIRIAWGSYSTVVRWQRLRIFSSFSLGSEIIVLQSKLIQSAVEPCCPLLFRYPSKPQSTIPVTRFAAAKCSSLHIQGACLNKSNFAAGVDLESMLPKKQTLSAGSGRARVSVSQKSKD
jgi:hypothetical protein